MPDQDLINRIRTIFLHQRPHVTIAEATVLLGWSRGEMSRAIAAGEVEVTSSAVGTWLWREELMAKALELWSPETIEEALGAEAEGVLPEAVRLIDLHVRLPRHQVAMLEHFAERDRMTVSGVLARELDGRVRTRTSFRGRWRGSRRRWRGRMRSRRRSSPAEASSSVSSSSSSFSGSSGFLGSSGGEGGGRWDAGPGGGRLRPGGRHGRGERRRAG